MTRPLCLCVLVTLVLCSTPAMAQSPGRTSGTEAHGFLVEVSYVMRSAAPSKLVKKHADLQREKEQAPTEEQSRLKDRLERLAAQIDRSTGYVVAGWAVAVDRRGVRTSPSTSMAGFVMVGNRRNNALLSATTPGAFVLVTKRGMKDAYVTGGRRYRKAGEVQKADAPNWWPTMHVVAPPPNAPDPEVDQHVELSMAYQRTTETESGKRHRYSIRLSIPEPREGADTARLAVRVDARTERGDAIGPIFEWIKLTRSEGGSFGQYRSWEILVPDRTRLDVNATTVTALVLDYEESS